MIFWVVQIGGCARPQRRVILGLVAFSQILVLTRVVLDITVFAVIGGFVGPPPRVAANVVASAATVGIAGPPKHVVVKVVALAGSVEFVSPPQRILADDVAFAETVGCVSLPQRVVSDIIAIAEITDYCGGRRSPRRSTPWDVLVHYDAACQKS